MYLLMFENMNFVKRDTVTKEDFQAVEDGRLEIIDIREPQSPLHYCGNGKWYTI